MIDEGGFNIVLDLKMYVNGEWRDSSDQEKERLLTLRMARV